MACSTEINSLPILTGCPSDTEAVMVMFSSASGNNGGYGLRYMGAVRQCWLAQLQFSFTQFKVGSAGSPISAGETALTITLPLTTNTILQGSVFITLGGTELPQNDTSQICYGIVYNSATSFTINFDQGVENGQQYILHYTYSQ